MYCVDDRSWRSGSATTRFRYSANAITRRLRVKSSRTEWPSSTSRSRTAVEPVPGSLPEPDGVGVSTITLTVSLRALLRGHRDRDGLLLGETLVAIAHRELEVAVDGVTPACRGRQLHGEREALLGHRVGVALRLVVAAG